MSKEPAGGASEENETAVDRFEHEIEELEHPLGHSFRQWIIGVASAAVLVGAFFVGAILLSRTTPKGDSRLIDTTIDTFEPQRSLLADKPTKFRWESISGAKSYIVRIQEDGGTNDLIARETRNNWLELTPEEQSRLVRGGRYIWSVRARSREGWSIAQGDSSFSL